jgi:preprotein translocase subunit Sec63
MAPIETTEDYYAILEISQSADSTIIKTNYKRLALARHPDKNPNNPKATVEFQLVSWRTIAGLQLTGVSAARSIFDLK